MMNPKQNLEAVLDSYSEVIIRAPYRLLKTTIFVPVIIGLIFLMLDDFEFEELKPQLSIVNKSFVTLVICNSWKTSKYL
jgi:hypothetical protein